MNHRREGKMEIACCLCFHFFVVQMNGLENGFELHCILRYWTKEEEKFKPIWSYYGVLNSLLWVILITESQFQSTERYEFQY